MDRATSIYDMLLKSVKGQMRDFCYQWIPPNISFSLSRHYLAHVNLAYMGVLKWLLDFGDSLGRDTETNETDETLKSTISQVPLLRHF
jgi:hypothetical protein